MRSLALAAALASLAGGAVAQEAMGTAGAGLETELPRLLAAVGSRFGSLALLPIHAHAGEVAHRLILRGRPQGRAPLRLLPGLVLHEPGGAWRVDVDAVLRGAGLGVDWWGRG